MGAIQQFCMFAHNCCKGGGAGGGSNMEAGEIMMDIMMDGNYDGQQDVFKFWQ